MKSRLYRSPDDPVAVPVEAQRLAFQLPGRCQCRDGAQVVPGIQHVELAQVLALLFQRNPAMKGPG